MMKRQDSQSSFGTGSKQSLRWLGRSWRYRAVDIAAATNWEMSLGCVQCAVGLAEHLVYGAAEGWQNRDCCESEEDKEQSILDEILSFFILHELLELLNHRAHNGSPS